MIRVGLIGCGYIAHKHIETLTQLQDVTLKAISDIHFNKMESIASLYKDFGGENRSITFFENYKDLLADKDIDLVIVAVFSGLHAEITKQAILYDKHVIVEKPLALSIQDAEEIIQLAQSRNRKILVCHQLRYRPLLQKVKQLMKQNYFGKIYLGVISLRLHRAKDYYHFSTWKGSWRKDGGMLVNQGIHLIDVLIWLLGDVESVYGEIATKEQRKETEDIAAGIFSFKDGSKGMVEANTITKPNNIGYYLAVFGERGTLTIGGKNFNEIHHCYIEGYPNIMEELNVLSKKLNEHQRMYTDFINAIHYDKEHLVNASEGKKALEAIFALYQSNKTDRPIFLPVESFSTSDMLL